MIREAIFKVVQKENLTYDEAYASMNEIMNGETSPTQNAAFLAALSTKNADAETLDEILGCAEAMREHALGVKHNLDVLEIVGTGGDRSHSFNISTTSAFVVASSGIHVAKHGNRAASSKCGAADCLEALGANISIEPERCVELLYEVGFCFFFAQKYHSSMKYVAATRKELGIRTVFNILGPLTNPARPTRQVMGVYSPSLLEPLAKVLGRLGVKRGMVVYGQDCLDEISLSAPTSIFEFSGDWLRSFVIEPEQFGLARCQRSELQGGDAAENAVITRRILEGEKSAKRDAVLLNAGAALYVGEKVQSIKDGVAYAANLIDSGKALETMERFIIASKKQKEEE